MEENVQLCEVIEEETVLINKGVGNGLFSLLDDFEDYKRLFCSLLQNKSRIFWKKNASKVCFSCVLENKVVILTTFNALKE